MKFRMYSIINGYNFYMETEVTVQSKEKRP